MKGRGVSSHRQWRLSSWLLTTCLSYNAREAFSMVWSLSHQTGDRRDTRPIGWRQRDSSRCGPDRMPGPKTTQVLRGYNHTVVSSGRPENCLVCILAIEGNGWTFELWLPIPIERVETRMGSSQFSACITVSRTPPRPARICHAQSSTLWWRTQILKPRLPQYFRRLRSG